MAWIANIYSKYRARDLRTTFENSKTRQNSSPKSSTWKETERESKKKTVVRTSNNFTSPLPTKMDKKTLKQREREREREHEFGCNNDKVLSRVSLSRSERHFPIFVEQPSPRWRSEKEKEKDGRRETKRKGGKNRSGKETKNSTLNHNYIVRSSTLLNWVVSIFCAASDATAVKMNKREKKSGSDVRKDRCELQPFFLIQFATSNPLPLTWFQWNLSLSLSLSLFSPPLLLLKRWLFPTNRHLIV